MEEKDLYGILGLDRESEALYVVRLEPESRRVVVGPRRALAVSRLVVREINWLGEGAAPEDGTRIEAKIRSAAAPAPARLRPRGDGTAELVFDQPQYGVASGQACVFYDGERLLGGGWIDRGA